MAPRYGFAPTERKKITTGTADPTEPANPAWQNRSTANDAFFNKARAARTKAPVANPEGMVGGEEYSAGDAVRSIKANDPTAVATEGKFGRKITGKYGTASISTPEQNLAKRDADLKARHPGLWMKDSPENQAFVAHAKEHGMESALANVDNIVKTSQVGNVAKPSAATVAANLARKAAAMGPGNPSPTSYPVPTKPSSTPSAESRDPTAGQVGSNFPGEFKKRVGGVFRDVGSAVMDAGKSAMDFVKGATAAPTTPPAPAPAPDPSTIDATTKKKKVPLPI